MEMTVRKRQVTCRDGGQSARPVTTRSAHIWTQLTVEFRRGTKEWPHPLEKINKYSQPDPIPFEWDPAVRSTCFCHVVISFKVGLNFN